MNNNLQQSSAFFRYRAILWSNIYSWEFLDKMQIYTDKRIYIQGFMQIKYHVQQV